MSPKVRPTFGDSQGLQGSPRAPFAYYREWHQAIRMVYEGSCAPRQTTTYRIVGATREITTWLSCGRLLALAQVLE